MWFPIATQQAAKNAATNWQIDFQPSNRDRVLKWITLQGPAGSAVNVFLDTVFLDTTPRGDFNHADYFAGIPIARGRMLSLIWNTGIPMTSGLTLPTASIGCDDGGNDLQSALVGNTGIFTDQTG